MMAMWKLDELLKGGIKEDGTRPPLDKTKQSALVSKGYMSHYCFYHWMFSCSLCFSITEFMAKKYDLQPSEVTGRMGRKLRDLRKKAEEEKKKGETGGASNVQESASEDDD